ncbi:MAG: uridine kinase [Ruthenibacterium lactatiformans]
MGRICATAREHRETAFRRRAGRPGALGGRRAAATGRTDPAAADRLCRAAGCPAVHHSAAYREQYAPHYRVVRRCYADAWPALLLAQRVLESVSPGGHALLAIDGRCGSGKSTLAAHMAQVFGCPVFHMDDFFLPPELRTPERLAQPGENVHHERFLREALEPFAAGQPVRFCPFDCSAGVPGSAVEIPAASFAVVEGSYSLHPSLRGHYTASVFVTCAQAVQRARLTARGGASGPYLKRAGFRWRKPILRPRGAQALADLTLDTTPLA